MHLYFSCMIKQKHEKVHIKTYVKSMGRGFLLYLMQLSLLGYTRLKQSGKCVPQFFIDGQRIQCVSRYTHLGHVISDKLDDKDNIINKRNSLCGKINNVNFCERDALVKLKLLRAYCSDFYGCVLWDLSQSSVEDVCIAWRRSLRRV